MGLGSMGTALPAAIGGGDTELPHIRTWAVLVNGLSAWSRSKT